MKNVLVLFGGVSNEYAVSCMSAASVIAHIPQDKYRVYTVGITKAGAWLYYTGDTQGIAADEWQQGDCVKAVLSPDRTDGGLLVFRNGTVEHIRIDIVFPVLHGKNGEDGTMQGLLEIAGLPYVGSGCLASAMCMDKAVTNLLADHAGIAQAAWLCVERREYIAAPERFAQRVEETLGYPVFVKPANAGSSVGVSKVQSAAELAQAMDIALHEDGKVVVETAVDAALEVECAVIGNIEPMASVVGGIVPCKTFYDYEAKYVAAESELQIPAHVSDAVQEAVRRTAVQIFTALGCKGLARVDFFLERGTDRVLFNEINTMPGFTEISMYSKLLEQSGVPYPKLLDRLFKLAQADA